MTIDCDDVLLIRKCVCRHFQKRRPAGACQKQAAGRVVGQGGEAPGELSAIRPIAFGARLRLVRNLPGPPEEFPDGNCDPFRTPRRGLIAALDENFRGGLHQPGQFVMLITSPHDKLGVGQALPWGELPHQQTDQRVPCAINEAFRQGPPILFPDPVPGQWRVGWQPPFRYTLAADLMA